MIVMHKIMYIILLLISTLSFGQEINNEISKSENFKKLLNLYKIADQEKYKVVLLPQGILHRFLYLHRG